MGSVGVCLLVAATLASGRDPAQAQSGDRLYGRVTTAAGRVLEGYLRWAGNEGSWADFLNGIKEMPQENREEADSLASRHPRDRERSVEFMGIRVSWEEEPDWPESAESGLRFGHVRQVRVLGDDEASIELKSGQRIELSGSSGDLGEGFRGLEVETPGEGTVELAWKDLDRIELMAPPPSAVAPAAALLHGTVEDRWGNRYTGYVAWDRDEILTSDVLDGKVDGQDRKIPFGDVAAIERASSQEARVTLASGEEVVLSGSNDVDDDNRGIRISDPGLGQVLLGWDELESARFHPPSRPEGYGDYDGGRRLRGTVVTDDGRELTGTIRWDNDEEWSWEILDGSFRDVVYDIELARVARITRRSSRSAEVTLRDGRTFELEDSNDVDRDNKGIFVTADDGSIEVVDWHSFRELTLEGH